MLLALGNTQQITNELSQKPNPPKKKNETCQQLENPTQQSIIKHNERVCLLPEH